MGDAKIKIALGLIAILIFAAPIAIAQEVPPHVVISEVFYDESGEDINEFCVLYNPKGSDIDIGNWKLKAFNQAGKAYRLGTTTTFPDDAIITAHKFYLIGEKDPLNSGDWGGTEISPDCIRGGTDWQNGPDDYLVLEDSGGNYIDGVRWGHEAGNNPPDIPDVPDNNTAPVVEGESIERKPLDDGYAPGQDTDNNYFDFAVQSTPTPENSLSPEMEPAPVELFDAADDFKGGFVKIQNAVDNADDEDTIHVDNGTYNENVVVDKPLTICSEFGAAYTTISALDSNDHVIYVIADYVKISGFKVNGTTCAGIYLNTTDYCNISNNRASNNNIGIRLYQSSYNTIINDTVSGNSWGIKLVQSNHNTITDNTVSDNSQKGIDLYISNNNHIYNNYFENTNNAKDDDNNIWDITKTDGPNIIGGPYLGGNYWSDYTGDDNNDDGLGDTFLPYNSSGNIENGGDSHPLVHEAAPSLSIEKSGEPDHMHPGGTLNYTINVENTGKATATNVNVTEAYDANVTFRSAVPAPSQGNDTWIFPTLNVGETKWINISVSVNPDTPSGTTLHNCVDVTCDEGVSYSATEDTVIADTCVPIVGDIGGSACFRTNGGTIVDLEAVAAAPTPFPEGFKFPYGFFKFNITGLEEGQKVNVTIKLPVYAPEGTKYWIYNGSGWSNITIKGGDDGDVNITITLKDGGAGDDDGKANGQIVVDQGGPGGKPPKITGFAPDSPVYDSVGACRTFNVTVNQKVDVTWEYPPGWILNTNSSVRNASFLWCRLLEGVYNLTASAENIYNRDAPDVQRWIWIVNQTGISVTKVGNVTVAKPSTLVNFNITINNTGNSTLNKIVVKDELPQWLIFSSAFPTPNATQHGILYGKPVTNVTWYLNESLAVNQSTTIELDVKIAENATGVLNNNVDVTGWPKTGNKVEADATAEVRVIGLAIEKSCKSSTASLGKTLEYTITYSNPGGTNLTDVVITENYPDALTFISAVPAPDSGTNNRWTIGTLPAGGPERTITIEMKVPDCMSDLSYEESGNVSGEGIVMISKELSTVQKPYVLENIVTISGSYEGTNVSASDSTITTVSVSGSSLEITEHGSGIYKSEEELSLSFEDGGIYFDKDTKAEYRPTTFNCSDGFVMEVTSKWSQDICSKNYAEKTAIHKTITGATVMDDNTRINSDSSYTMDFDSSFDGYLRVGKKTKDAATSEHYIGKFVITDWDESGDESVEGVGYVIVDKELASGRLLLMEHGSGTYSSEEEDSSSSKIYKTTYAVYEPTQFNFSDSFVVNFSSKWMQDFCTMNKKGTTALHKKIRDATYIDDDTQARSSPSLTFESFFLGATHVGSRSLGSRASEDYIGEFYISWGAATYYTPIFDWDKVPGVDNKDLITHLSEDKFGMPWVTDADVEITKPASDTIDITDTADNHSATIILNTTTNETADLTVAGGGTFEFKVEKHGDTLRVYDTEFERKPEEVMGEGFVMLDESIIYKGGQINVAEHGSGIYHSHEDFGKTTKTIEKSTYGEYKPYFFSFADSFAVNLSSMWVQDICAKDEAEGTAIRKRISNAALMKDDSIVTKSSLDLDSSFNGSMHIGARTGDIRISEDYIGEFNVTQVIRIVKEEPSESSSDPSDWLFCPFPLALTTPSGDELTCLFPFDLSSTPATSHGLHTHWPWSCPSHWDWAPP